jgi:hypothetical protein
VISSYAFRDCTSLEEVQFQLPSNLAKIDKGAFQGCQSLTEIYIVKSVSEIVGNFIHGSGVRHVVVDPGNRKFQTIKGSMLERDGTCLVSYFGVERDVRIPSHIETIGDASFEKCGDVRSVTFEPGSKLTHIESWAFYEASSLEEVHFRSLRPAFAVDSFAKCTQLNMIVFQVPSGDSASRDQFTEKVASQALLAGLIHGNGGTALPSE